MALSNAPETTTTAATTTTISSTDNNNNNDEEDSVVSLFSDATSRLNFTLTNHVPLGCIIDESLAVSSSSERLVFISQIKDQSNAQAAGLQVGDVIVGVSSLFGTLVENVTFAGIEKM
jgi:predicted metalloprotease with PDZ domain